MSSSKNLIWFKNFPNGGFANSVFEYLFIKYIQQELKCEILLGHNNDRNFIMPRALLNIEEYYFENTDATASCISETVFLAGDRRKGPENDLSLLNHLFSSSPGSCIIINGYFQYDTNLIRNNKIYNELFYKYLFPRKDSNNLFQRLLFEYKKQLSAIDNTYFIGAHIRLGDYLDYSDCNNPFRDIFYTMDLDKCCKMIVKFIHDNKIVNPCIYIASDDLEQCVKYFTKYNLRFITRNDLLSPDQTSDINELIVDIAGLSNSNFVVASNSSLSILSCLLNESARTFVRQDKDGNFFAFDPWATPVLLGL
jgi:hypothetical protein